MLASVMTDAGFQASLPYEKISKDKCDRFCHLGGGFMDGVQCGFGRQVGFNRLAGSESGFGKQSDASIGFALGANGRGAANSSHGDEFFQWSEPMAGSVRQQSFHLNHTDEFCRINKCARITDRPGTNERRFPDGNQWNEQRLEIMAEFPEPDESTFGADPGLCRQHAANHDERGGVHRAAGFRKSD